VYEDRDENNITGCLEIRLDEKIFDLAEQIPVDTAQGIDGEQIII
jgi:hypothetical protein